MRPIFQYCICNKGPFGRLEWQKLSMRLNGLEANLGNSGFAHWNSACPQLQHPRDSKYAEKQITLQPKFFGSLGLTSMKDLLTIYSNLYFSNKKVLHMLFFWIFCDLINYNNNPEKESFRIKSFLWFLKLLFGGSDQKFLPTCDRTTWGTNFCCNLNEENQWLLLLLLPL